MKKQQKYHPGNSKTRVGDVKKNYYFEADFNTFYSL